MINETAHAYFRINGYTAEGITSVCREVDERFLAARIEFTGQAGFKITVTKKVHKTGQGHVPAVMAFFEEVANLFGLWGLKGSFVVWLEDGMWEFENHLSKRAPILAFGRRYCDYQTFLVPDPAFLWSKAYKEEIQEIVDTEVSLPWEVKQPTVFWRGAGTGCGIDGDNWQAVPRIRLAYASKEMNDLGKLDAAISLVVKYPDQNLVQRVYDLGIVKDYCPFKEFLRYRYLVDVDGFCCAWKSLFHKLSSRSAVLKVHSEYLQWYHDKLMPWVHYIPVKSDVSDIKQVIEWIHAHDSECRHIAENASSLMKTITYYDAARDVARLITELVPCQRG